MHHRRLVLEAARSGHDQPVHPFALRSQVEVRVRLLAGGEDAHVDALLRLALEELEDRLGGHEVRVGDPDPLLRRGDEELHEPIALGDHAVVGRGDEGRRGLARTLQPRE